MNAIANALTLTYIACGGILGAILLGLALLHQQREHKRRCAALQKHLQQIEECQRKLNTETWGAR